MNPNMLFVSILLPVVLGIISLLTPKRARGLHEFWLLLGTAATLAVAILFFGKTVEFSIPWNAFGVDLSFRLYHFSAFILLAAAAFSFLVALYISVWMKGHAGSKYFFSNMLVTLGFVNGAVLANNLVVLLFFWGSLLILLFGMVMTNGLSATKTSIKALVLNGVADLCLILGVGMAGYLAGTFAMDKINLPLQGSVLGTSAFLLMMIGAIAKAGSMPFHSWIPDAAIDVPLPFMALMPGALEKLLGIYLLSRISLDLFQLTPGSAMSVTMMIIGSATILLAVMMALVQKNYKRLLAYHAISQVGYMILGIGTALPVGIVGGLFHMINHAMYKSTLFLTAGSVERQTGTADLEKLGGLARKMPVTFGCFLVAAIAISGIPPMNGFFSKELVLDAALESNFWFYLAALLGAFLTLASFLKLGHAAYFGKLGKGLEKVHEAPVMMLIPMIVLAAGCILFGVYNPLPLNGLIQPILGDRLEGENFAGFHMSMLVVISLCVFALAALNHIYGFHKTKRGLGAVDHIHYAPGLKQIYAAAEKRYFDPYDIGMAVVNGVSKVLFAIDRGIDFLFAKFPVLLANWVSLGIRKAHTGNHWVYIAWVLGGLALTAVLFSALSA